MSDLADVLNRAADLIERDGWVQGRFRGPNGEHCATDAVVCACEFSMVVYNDAVDVLLEAIRRQNLPRWNDEPGRTQAEVVAKLRAAARRGGVMNHLTDDTAVQRELRTYFLARTLCLRADPPCAVRPCAAHEDQARRQLAAAPQTDHRPRSLTPRAAVGAADTAQNGA